MRHPIPDGAFYVDVFPQIPQFSFKVDFPPFLLPASNQRSIIILTAERSISKLKIETSGLSVQLLNLLTSDGQEIQPEFNEYNRIPKGVSTIPLRIEAKNSGVFSIHLFSSKFNEEQKIEFTVTDYLIIRALYRKTAKSVQLSISSKKDVSMILSNVSFFNDETPVYSIREFGIPFNVDLIRHSAIFILEGEPNFVLITLKQTGLDPFSLRAPVLLLINLNQNLQKHVLLLLLLFLFHLMNQ